MEMSRLTTDFPDEFLESSFASIYSSINRETAGQMIDSELALWGKTRQRIFKWLGGSISAIIIAGDAYPPVTHHGGQYSRGAHNIRPQGYFDQIRRGR